MKEDHRYDDIIHLPHHVSASHPQMPLADRAAQFSPFAALTGHGALLQETGRLTEEWAEPEEDQKALLDLNLQQIRRALSVRDGASALPETSFTYFQPDERKRGGTYVTATGRVKKIDESARRILLEDGTVLEIPYLTAMSLCPCETTG